MNDESIEILRNARADYRAGNITRQQYADIVLSVTKAELDMAIIYHGGEIDVIPTDLLYTPDFAEA